MVPALAGHDRIDAVDVGADGLLESLVDAGADTADEDVGRDTRFINVEVGHQELDVLGFLQSRLDEPVAGHGGHGYRYVLQALCTVRGSDDDLFERPFTVLRESRRCDTDRQCDAGEYASVFHSGLPRADE